jgi:DNA-binding beta-propeller fold protein YncE
MLLVVLSVAGCATGGGSFRGKTTDRELQWPPLPQTPKIVWVKEVKNHQDVGIAKGFWKRVAEFIAGAEENGIGKPYGVFVDENERLFIVDVKLAIVHMMDTRNHVYTAIGAEGDALMISPIAVTEDDEENLYITDSAAKSVFQYNIRAKTLKIMTNFKLSRPTGIAFNKRNRLLYITDTSDHMVRVFTLDGVERFHVGGRGDANVQFNYPTDLFVDDRGQLYVTDSLNSRIQIFSPDGQFLQKFGEAGDTLGNFSRPKGVAVDSAGHIYVCDALLDTVQIFDASGKLLLAFGENGTDAGKFWMPSGIFIDSEDYIYVADSYNRRVQVFKYLRQEDPRLNMPNKKPAIDKTKL